MVVGVLQLVLWEPKDLIDVWVRSFPIADGVYSAVAYVENQNRDLYVPEVQFEFELYDENNKRITRASDRTIIMPNGITPVFVPRILTGMRAATSASFRFVKDPEFKKVPRSYGFNVSDVFFEVLEDKPPYVRALARNVSDFIVEKVDFVVILYDEGGAAVTASRTFEENMDPQETRTLQYSWVQPLRLRDDECPEGTCKKKIERVEIVPVVLEW